MRVAATSDWRDDLPFDTAVVVADVSPGEPTRCSVCGADSAPRPRTELLAVKHRHPNHHSGYVRFYCREHAPRTEPPKPVGRTAARAERRPAARRTAPSVERERMVCPDCFVEVPPTGVCGMCGRTVA